jgi:anti-sigma factor RsiW
MTKCDHAETLRDYAFDELPAAERLAMDQHLAACRECSHELDQLRLTTAALRILPDREIPQRIAFVSDKVFKPSRFRNPAAWLGFASACVLSAGLIVSAYHRPVEIRTIVQTAAASAPAISKPDVDSAVAKAVAQAVQASDRQHEQQHRALMAAMQENLEVMQKRLGAYTTLASAETPRTVTGQ